MNSHERDSATSRALVFKTLSAVDLAGEGLEGGAREVRRASQLKRRLSIMSEDPDGGPVSGRSIETTSSHGSFGSLGALDRIGFALESGLTPRSASSLSLQDLESPRTSGSVSPRGNSIHVHNFHSQSPGLVGNGENSSSIKTSNGGITNSSSNTKGNLGTTHGGERKFTIGGGIDVQAQRRSSALGALSPIHQGRGGTRAQHMSPTRIFAAIMTVIMICRKLDN
ncbi:Hypothetical Protein FCC1311_067972 [Hondaea fermentalgiana]|uniref:Uncharacterized protein n=1 Tax=Hondaea fermentalgiana TaxID=2315210 RepID=A0A2R5GI65_9STRA|nr:Hypothetical Protein FCC1311_067972 [Hondaea fermentalgiana]|eukprot:GBG30577.1 Hypothetical Protein FCC1311_067972 [Hondaea fermentalgiana]